MTDAPKLAADAAEPSASAYDDELFSPYRSPGFLVEPLAADRRDGSLATTLGLCAALAWLGGSFTLAQHAGSPALGIACLMAGAVLTSAARRSAAD